jgi:hypothetical protein
MFGVPTFFGRISFDAMLILPIFGSSRMDFLKQSSENHGMLSRQDPIIFPEKKEKQCLIRSIIIFHD